MIKMHDVLFGEFIEIESDKRLLIVDCGCNNRDMFNNEKSITFDRYTENSFIVCSKIKKKKLVMISHFHDDHINGFSNLKSFKFEKVYVPYISTHNNNVFIFKKALLAYIFGGYRTKKNAKGYLEQVELAFSLSSKGILGIKPIGRGDKIKYDNYNHNILWPSKHKEILIDISKLKVAIAKLRNYKIFDDILASMNKLFEEYIKYLNIINNTDTFDSVYNLENMRDLLVNFYNKVKEIENQIIKRIKSEVIEIRETINQMNSDINKTSIVDSIIIKGNKNQKNKAILLTGDITKQIYEKYLANYVSKVTILKAPHHGTNKSKHYSSKLPDADYLIISNGGFINRKITNKYKHKYKDIRCTHGVCVSGTTTCEITGMGVCPSGCTCYRKEIKL